MSTGILLKSNALNLNRHTLGQLVDSNTATGGLVGEELLVGGVHLGEVGHVSQEDLERRLVGDGLELKRDSAGGGGELDIR